MKWLICIDNGGEYSSFRRWPAIVCDSKIQADMVVDAFDKWVKNFTDEVTSEDGWVDWEPADVDAFLALYPFPFPKILEEIRYEMDYRGMNDFNATAQLIPEWADGLK